jgi:hypothetical protein
MVCVVIRVTMISCVGWDSIPNVRYASACRQNLLHMLCKTQDRQAEEALAKVEQVWEGGLPPLGLATRTLM